MTDQTPRFKKLMELARTEIKLTADERADLANMLLRREIGSWKNLDEVQVDRLLDACEGYLLIKQLLDMRF